jgi:hypothetical protein
MFRTFFAANWEISFDLLFVWGGHGERVVAWSVFMMGYRIAVELKFGYVWRGDCNHFLRHALPRLLGSDSRCFNFLSLGISIPNCILAVYPSQNETGNGCLSKSLWSHMRNMLPSRFEIRVSFWNGYISVVLLFLC